MNDDDERAIARMGAPAAELVARPLGIAVVCACGAGWPASPAIDWQAELADHLQRRHPDATAVRLTLSCFPDG